MQQCQVRVFNNFFPRFDLNEWCRKNGLGHEFSALTTRPRLLPEERFVYAELVSVKIGHIKYTVKLVYNGHPWNPKKVAYVHR